MLDNNGMKIKFRIPTILHFLVDFFCIFGLFFHSKTDETYLIGSFIYMILAFAIQPIVGLFIDKFKNEKALTSLSVCLVLIGFISMNIYSHAIFSGIGNSLFHVAAGKIILDKSEKSSPLGVFISFGAIGVGLASSFDITIISYLSIFLAVVMVFLGVLNFFTNYDTIEYNFENDSKFKDNKTIIIAVVLICFSVIVRGMSAHYNDYSWSLPNVLFYIGLVSFAGKFIGGFIKDYLGEVVLIILSGALSIVAVFFQYNVIMSFIGIFGCNLLMALTLDYVRKAMPTLRATSFGLLANMLTIGTYLGQLLIENHQIGYTIYISLFIYLANIIVLFVVYFLFKKKNLIGGKN